MTVPYGGEREWPICVDCGREIEFDDCFNCGGEGGRDLYEEDPLYYAPDDWEDCSECHGGGVIAWCPVHGRVATKRRPLVVVESDRL